MLNFFYFTSVNLFLGPIGSVTKNGMTLAREWWCWN